MPAMQVVLAVAALLLPLSGANPPSLAPVHTTVDRGNAASPAGQPPSKLLVFVVENHSLRQMRARMPFTRRLATRYGYATGYRAATHPSLPNYLAITTGSTHGIRDDGPPSAHPVTGPSVFGQALENGKTARLYAEGMPTPCAMADSGRYAVRHNPWAYQLDERAHCRRHDVPLNRLAGDVATELLPNAGMVIPDLCHDAHDCALRSADRWLRRYVGMVMAGDDWASGRLVVVITADEDAHNQHNRVLTVVAHPSIRGVVVDEALSHYSLSRSYSQMIGAVPLGHAKAAASLTAAFGVPVPRPRRHTPTSPVRTEWELRPPRGHRSVRIVPTPGGDRCFGGGSHLILRPDGYGAWEEAKGDGRDAGPGRGLRPAGP